jgi:hypothetical protein
MLGLRGEHASPDDTSYLLCPSAAHSEKYFTSLIQDPSFKVKLSGSWETVVGELDTFGGFPMLSS